MLAFKSEERAFYLYGFAKNKRANVSDDELKALKFLATELLGYKVKQLTAALESGALVEIEANDDG